MQKQLFRGVTAVLTVLPLLVGCGGLNGPIYAGVDGQGTFALSDKPEDIDKMPRTSGGSSGKVSAAGAKNGANALAEGMDSIADAMSCGGMANAYAKGDGSMASANSNSCK